MTHDVITDKISPRQNSAQAHVPVLLPEVITALKIRAHGTYVDATLGRGGYAEKMLESAACHVIAFDRDAAAIAAAQPLVARYAPRLVVHHAPFSQMADVITQPVDGVVFDLGVSSPQLDEATRGFSFRHDGPLDMRMDQTRGETAADVVNTRSEKDLADMIYQYGEEKMSRQIARAILAQRHAQPFSRTQELAELVRGVVKTRQKIDAATRTFQALRIVVNDELGQLRAGLHAAEKILVSGGRLAVVSFHSLEDRMVKQFLVRRARMAAGNRHMPVNDNAPAPSFKLVGPQPITPTDAECSLNPRARSARLRVAERTSAHPFSVDPMPEVA